MSQLQFPNARGHAVGADVGATLIKLAIRAGEGEPELETLPAAALDAAARRVSALAPEPLGLTGGGALQLARRLGGGAQRVEEFAAWGCGAHELLRGQGLDAERFLLVSVGTGTSAMLVEPQGVRRVGGTALGGGTLLGLASVLFGTARFDEVVALAARGDRRRVDLLVGDIYPEDGFSLPAELNAASFARLAGRTDGCDSADLAHALIGMVGENVGLVCGGLARGSDVRRIVFGGGTLRDNPPLVDVLHTVSVALGCEPVFLARGEFAGAVGALAHADRVAGARAAGAVTG
jgi:type II pantothenate kinase